MKREPLPWYWRAVLCVLAAVIATLLVSGSIFWFSYEAYNPWLHPGGERDQWTNDLIWNALRNIGEHSIYAAVLLFSGPFWFYGKPVEPFTLLFFSAAYSLVIGFLVATLLFGHLDLAVTHLRFEDAKIVFVAFWQRIYVPNHFYIIASYAIPFMSVWCLAALDAVSSIAFRQLCRIRALRSA